LKKKLQNWEDLLSNGFIIDDCLSEIQNLMENIYSEELKKFVFNFIHPNDTTLFQFTEINDKKKN
jgi:hypothetical protein